MSPILLALAATIATPASPAVAAPVPTVEETRFKACVALIDEDPAKAITEADNWRLSGNGGVLSRQCLGMAYAAQERWLPALAAFEQAARQAETLRDSRAARIWVQAGNAGLAAGDAPRAQSAFNAALAAGVLKGAEAGEVHLDRARALVLQRQNAAARTDLDAALKLVPQDPLGWLLSATLARRMGDLKRAQADIAEAAKRSPDDASVALEAGNIAALSGADEAARTAWSAAVKLAPDSPAGKSAAAALAQFNVPAKAR
jgi:tetratricopeptide (TPR) repeat protein